MSTAAAMGYQPKSAVEPVAAQLPEEELNKLQEIHELINLMFKELPLGAQSLAQPYFASALPVAPYPRAYHPWPASPFVPPPGY